MNERHKPTQINTSDAGTKRPARDGGKGRIMSRLLSVCFVLLFVALFPAARDAFAATETFTTAGTGNWTAPAGVTSVTVEAWGAGGGGGGTTTATNGESGGGGGGGEYRKDTVTVTPGNNYSYVVGTGGTGGVTGVAGGNTTFNGTSVVATGGGGGAGGPAGAGGAGGAVGTGAQANFNGGAGGTGAAIAGAGAGGGGAGATGAGGNGGTGATVGAAGAGDGTAGAGGAGGTANNASGVAGNIYGGGGGGGVGKNGTGAAGAGGYLRLTYTAPNSPPAVPTNPAQYQSDGTTVIGVGGYATSTTVVFGGDLSDPDGDTVKLQIDYTGDNVSDCESALVASGTINAQVTCTGLTDGTGYDWQYRAVDSLDAASVWTAFNAATPDFTVDATAPTDGTLTATSGDSLVGLSWAAATDATSGVASYDLRFDTAGAVADCVSGTSLYTGALTTFSHTGLTNGTTYYYRVCATDNAGNQSAGSTASATPSAGNSNPNVPTALAQFKSDGTTAIASGGYTNETTVRIQADISDPDAGDTIKLQVDIDSNGSSDCESTLAATPQTNVQVSCAVANGNSYNWQVRTVDNSGATSAWVPFAGSPDFIVDTVAPTVTINQAGGQADPTGTSPINFTVVFSESVANFATGDVTITGTAGGTKTATVTGSGTTYNVAVTGMTTDGTVIASIGAGVATDAAGNGNTASTSTDNSVSWTTVPVCTRNAPTFSIAPTTQNVKTNQSVVYTLTVVNNDTAECADSSTFNIAITSETGDTVDFMLPSVRSANSVSVAAGGTSNSAVTLTVTSAGAAVDGKALTSLLTLSDGVNHNSMNQTASVVTTVANFNPMIHSSLSTGSSKWGGSWGISQAGSKYGEFTCGTCHVRNAAPNIKRVKGTLTSGSADPFPIQADGGTISFLDTRDGSASFGNDAGGHATSSRICEGCHSITNYHRYNTTVDPDGAGPLTAQANLTHYNQSDCMACHKHSDGFKPAGCNGCHGSTGTGQYWPDGVGGNPAYADDSVGAHDNHIEAISTYLGYGDLATLLAAADTGVKQKTICAFCHPDPGGSGHATDSGDSRVDLVAAGSFSKYTGGGTSALDATSGAYSFANASCSNIACHNGVATPSGATNWNTPPAAPDCTLCHTGAGASLRHDVHVTTKGYACTQCHTNHGTYPTGTGAPLRHADGLVQLEWTNAGSFEQTFGGGSITYSQAAPLPYKDATWGTCATAACHNNTLTPAWNAALTGSCTVCHTSGPSDATHTAHTGSSATYGRVINCTDCHGAGTTTTTPPTAGHINGTFSVAGSVPFTYSSNSCGTNVCHNSGTNTAPVRAYTWGTALANDCASCHAAVPPSTEAHNEHMSNGYTGAACTDCHTAASNANHMNGTVSLDATKVTYSAGASVALRASALKTDTCSTASCHNRPLANTTKSAAWNTAGDLACDACHYYAASPTGAANEAFGSMKLTSSHSDHFTAGKVCTQCHGALPVTTAHISSTAKAAGLTGGAVPVQTRATVDFTLGGAGHLTDYTFASSSCSSGTNNGLGCHATAAAFTWTNTLNSLDVATQCVSCHTNTTNANVNPVSGLHAAGPTVSGQAHNQTLIGGCAACHVGIPAKTVAASTHATGTFQGDGSVATNQTAMGLTIAATNGYQSTGTTNNGTGTCATTCHNGAGDNGTWARKWDSSIHYAALAPASFATCAGCHGGFGANDWTFSTAAGTGVGQLDNTTDGSVSHGRNWDGDANTSEVIGNHSGSTNATKCNSCHVYGDAEYLLTGAGKHHRDGNITMNSTAGYQRTTTTPNYGCTASCHSNNANHGMENSNWTLGTLAGPAMSCTTCHSGTGGGGLNVSSASPHTIVGTNAGYNTFTGCETCHPQHTGGVLVPNETRVGINYTADARTGFRLGGTATVGTTEAEICWNCHGNLTYQTTAISEWGVNNKQPGTPAAVTAYNWGTISGTGNWIGATWTSAQATLFSYKTGAIQSTHAANFAATTPGMDTVANIRCSYCHDVHDTYGTTGKPYLRGTWWTNPYLEDGAPVQSITYTGVIPFGNVPRAQASQNQLGGYQIDQNNNNPTATGGTGTGGAWTVADSAGLCWLCHNQNRVGTAVTVNTLDWFGTNDWATNGSGQINGHSNAVVGGTGSNRVNIFRTSWRAPSGLTTTGARPDMGYANHGTGVGYGYRATDARGFTGHSPPTNAGNARPYGGGLYNWGATVNDTTTDIKYHNFSCSKCHNPHASRLPRLMVTNCLDTKHNTWDNVRTGITALTVSSANSSGVTLNGTTAPDSWGRTWSNVQSAQNCHRLADPAVNPTNTTNYGRGWNNVTPW